MILLVDGINYAEGTLMNYRLQQIQKCKLSLNKYRHGKNITKNKISLFIIVGLLIFILATYLIGDKQNMFGKTSDLGCFH
jgi:uncharacterized membrane protein